MDIKDKQKLKQTIQTQIISLICDNVENDEEMFLALLYANEKIALELTHYNDIYDDIK